MTAPDVPHPRWCRGRGCDAATTHGHTSRTTTIRTSPTTRLVFFLESGTSAGSPPVLLLEGYACACRSCEPRELVMLNLDQAAALHEGLGRLLTAAGPQ